MNLRWCALQPGRSYAGRSSHFIVKQARIPSFQSIGESKIRLLDWWNDSQDRLGWWVKSQSFTPVITWLGLSIREIFDERITARANGHWERTSWVPQWRERGHGAFGAAAGARDRAGNEWTSDFRGREEHQWLGIGSVQKITLGEPMGSGFSFLWTWEQRSDPRPWGSHMKFECNLRTYCYCSVAFHKDSL